MCKQIIIFYQHISREFDSCNALKSELESSMDCTVKVFSIDFEYSKAIKFAKRNKVDIVVMPWCHHVGNYQLLMPFLKLNKNLTAINLHHEQIGTPISMDVLLPKDAVVKENIYNFCWGEFYKSMLQRNGISQDLLFITGNIRLDMATKTFKTREDLQKEFKLDLKKKWILFAECRDSVWTFGEKDIEETVRLGCDRNEVIESMEANKKGIIEFFDDISKLSDDFFEKYELIYRPHPGTICPLEIDKRIKVTSSYSIYEWLVNIDYYLTSTSTSIFEAESLNVPCFRCERDDWPDKFLIYGLERYDKMNSILEFENFIENHSGLYNGIYKDYIGEIGGNNIKRTALTIREIAEKDFVMSAVKFSNRARFKKWLYEVVTRMSCRFGVLEKLKYPRSAYRERNDIPYYKDNLKKFSNVENVK